MHVALVKLVIQDLTLRFGLLFLTPLPSQIKRRYSIKLLAFFIEKQAVRPLLNVRNNDYLRMTLASICSGDVQSRRTVRPAKRIMPAVINP